VYLFDVKLVLFGLRVLVMDYADVFVKEKSHDAKVLPLLS